MKSRNSRNPFRKRTKGGLSCLISKTARLTCHIVTFFLISLLNYQFVTNLITYKKLPDGTYMNRYSSPTKTKSSIPHIIWQTAKSHKTPPRASRKIINSWYKHNPTWKRQLLDDDELLNFMNAHFNKTVVESYLNLPLAVMRADFFRYAVIYFDGGVYADVDVQLKKSIEKWSDNAIDKCDVIIGLENDEHICNWGFAGRSKHLLFQKAVELSLERFVSQEISLLDESTVHVVTGPELFTDAVSRLAKEGGCSDLIVSKKDKNNAKELYDRCRDLLKEKYNVCLYDKQTQEGWFKNHYASQNFVLQSSDFVSSWIDHRNDSVFKTTGVNSKEKLTFIQKLGKVFEYIRYQF